MTEQEMIEEVARTGCEYSYTTIKGVVQPASVSCLHRPHRAAPVHEQGQGGPQAGSRVMHTQGQEGGGPKKRHNPQRGRGQCES